MAVKEYSGIAVFIGDISAAINPDAERGKLAGVCMQEEPFCTIQKKLGCKAIVLLRQVHGIEGRVIAGDCADFPILTHEGDYLITQEPGVAVGVVTADCLPFIVYDPIKQVVAVIHAGWKGLVAGIVQHVISRLQQEFGSEVADLLVIHGPAADSCCYEVRQDFIDQMNFYYPKTKAFSVAGDRITFSLVRLLREILFESGFSAAQLEDLVFDCTMCSDHYCSYRRDNKSNMRQLTVVSLK